MRKGWLLAVVCASALGGAMQLGAQDSSSYTKQDSALAAEQSASPVAVTGKGTCACGAHPPGPPRDRVVVPYAGEPADLSPYAKFAAPYDLNYIHPNIYSGAGRDLPEPKDVKEVRIGFFGPVAPNPESVFGLRMMHGAQLAVEEANAHGGYGGKAFKLMPHNEIGRAHV